MKRVSMTVAAFLVTAITFSAAADEVTYRKHIRPLFQDRVCFLPRCGRTLPRGFQGE